MTRWYRAYAGTVKDDKLAEAAIVAGCSRSVAIAVWHALLESAAETDDGGRFETTARRVAAILGEPAAVVDAMFAAMAEIGMIEGDAVAAWKRRQFESDSSTERSRRHREAKRNAVPDRQNGNATLQGRSATPPDTEAETDIQLADANCSSPQRRHDDWPEDFSGQLWSAYPRKTEKKAGMDALARLHRADRVSWADIMAGVEGLAGCDPQYVPALARWLKGERWKDERPSQRPGTGPPARESRHDKLDRAFDEVFASGPVQERPFLRLA